MKKKLLIVYTKMIVGGSTSSLLSLLNEIDFSRYNVDLLLLERGGVLEKEIPASVNILDNTFLSINKKRIAYFLAFLWALFLSILYRNPLIRSQIMSKQLVKNQPSLKKEYHIAVAYLEFWPSNFVFRSVKADRKILWIHCDYIGAGLLCRLDRKMYESVDCVVLVSDACEKVFKDRFPTVNTCTIRNILSQSFVSGQSDAFFPKTELFDAELVFVTVARIDFRSKAHDRAAMAFSLMKAKYPNRTFKWLILGDGPDKTRLELMVDELGLENQVVFLGEQVNPHPYISRCDVLLLPSRYEGKPMAVTEAQMHSVVPFVTNYTSSKDQIRNMQDGLVCENSGSAVTELMDRIFSREINIEQLRQNLKGRNFSNPEELQKIYQLFDGD